MGFEGLLTKTVKGNIIISRFSKFWLDLNLSLIFLNTAKVGVQKCEKTFVGTQTYKKIQVA